MAQPFDPQQEYSTERSMATIHSDEPSVPTAPPMPDDSVTQPSPFPSVPSHSHTPTPPHPNAPHNSAQPPQQQQQRFPLPPAPHAGAPPPPNPYPQQPPPPPPPASHPTDSARKSDSNGVAVPNPYAVAQGIPVGGPFPPAPYGMPPQQGGCPPPPPPTQQQQQQQQATMQGYAFTTGPPVQPATGVVVGGPPVFEGSPPHPDFPSSEMVRMPLCGGCGAQNGWRGPRAGAMFRCWRCRGVTTLPMSWQPPPKTDCTVM